MNSKKLKRFLSVALSLSMAASWNMTNISASMPASTDAGHAYGQEAEGHVHQWALQQTVQEATCVAEGTGLYECVNGCGQTEYMPIPATGHSYEAEDFDKDLPENFKVTQEAACTEAGVKEYTCTTEGCTEETEGHVKEEEIPATGHVWSEEESIQEATGTEPGYTYIECTVCHEIQEGSKKEIPAEGSVGKPGNEEPTEEPGNEDPAETEDPVQDDPSEAKDPAQARPAAPKKEMAAPAADAGIAPVDDSGSQPSDSETCDENGHKLEESPLTEADCTQNGLIQITCKCGETLEFKVVPAHHGYQKVVVDDDGNSKVVMCAAEEIAAEKASVNTTSYPATCTKAGKEIYTCKICKVGTEGHKATVAVPKKGHDYGDDTADTYDFKEGEDEIVPATCKEDGYKQHVCTKCDENEPGHILRLELPNTGMEHEWQPDSENSTPQTCTQPAIKAYKCSNCQATKTEQEGKRRGHDYEKKDENGVVIQDPDGATETTEVVLKDGLKPDAVKNPTCSEAGSETYNCTGCNQPYEKVISKLAHTPGEVQEVKKATCERNALFVSMCQVCGADVEEDVVEFYKKTMTEEEATEMAREEGYLQKTGHDGHTWECIDPFKLATCTINGLGEYKCKECGITETQVIVAHHAYMDNDGNVDKDYITNNKGNLALVRIIDEPTCTTAGEAILTCGICKDGTEGKTKTVELKATGHNYQDASEVTAEYEKITDSDGNEIILNCKPGKKVLECTNDCDSVKEVIAAAEVPHEESTEIIPATCESPALTGKHCAKCNEALDGELQPSGSRAGHSYEAKEEGALINPDEIVLDPEALRDETQSENAVCGKEGVDVYVCTLCKEGDKNHTYRVETDALEHDSKISAVEKANCYHNALAVKKCSKCGEIQSQVDLVEQNHLDEETAKRAGYWKTEHEWELTSVVVEADCDTNGLGIYTCKNCGDEISKTTPAHHAYEDEEGNILEAYGTEQMPGTVGKVTEMAKPTCTKKGIKTYTCTDCDDGTDGHTRVVESEPIGHVFDEDHVTEEWEEGRECHPGVRTYTCAREDDCDKIDNKLIEEIDPKYDHNYVMATIEATCESPAKVGEFCTRCKEAKDEDAIQVTGTRNGHSYEVLDAEGHFTVGVSFEKNEDGSIKVGENGKIIVKTPEGFGEGEGAARKGKYEITVDPTCEKEGLVTITCLACEENHTETLTVPMLAHNYTREYVPATCLSAGKFVYTCEKCGATKEEDVASDPIDEVNGHKWVTDEALSNPATCTEAGSEVRTCSICKKTETVRIDPEHNWKPAEEVRDSEGILMGMTRTCQGVCGKTEAVFVENGYAFCKNCEAIVTPTCIGGTAVTCEKDGSTAQEICPECHETLKESQTIPATGHEWALQKGLHPVACGPTYDQKICSKCGAQGEKTIIIETDETANHSYTKTKVIEATSCKDLQKVVKVCGQCGFEDTKNAMEVAGSGLPHKFVGHECEYGCGTKDAAAVTSQGAYVDSQDGKTKVSFMGEYNVADPSLTVKKKGILYVTAANYNGADLVVGGSSVNEAVVSNIESESLTFILSISQASQSRILYARAFMVVEENVDGSTVERIVYGNQVSGSYNSISAAK